MTWLFGELWFLILLAFLLGSVLAWLVARIALPHVDDVEREAGQRAEGVL